jgi:hypothetical protein
MSTAEALWPELSYPNWRDTAVTLQLWTQIVGKTRLALTPWLNHSWQVPLYVTSRGLGTLPIPAGREILEMEFDFIAQRLGVRTSRGAERFLVLAPQSVSEFYRQLMSQLRELGIVVSIHETPNEVADPIPFPNDVSHRSYDAAAAHGFWRALIQADRIFKQFRTGFLGKASPVHFFWGSFDLAVTRFSGRTAPPRPDPMMQEAYSQEVSSVGFWPGGGDIKGPAFYSYTTPEPAGFKTASVLPKPAFYHQGIGEFLLMYDDIRSTHSPESELMDFFQTTYDAGANLGNWDRAALER